jgi:hypothetical protein
MIEPHNAVGRMRGQLQLPTSQLDDKEDLPWEYLSLAGGQSYVVCAFYTPDYLCHVLVLKRSLENLGINHFFKRYERAANWEATTRIKPAFIEECLAKLAPRHVLYLDADAAVRQAPLFLDGVATDVAISAKPRKKRDSWHVRINPNTVYVRNTPGGRQFVQAWQQAERQCGAVAIDGDMLQIAVGNSPGLTLTILPGVEGKTGNEEAEVVFEQFHVSRGRFKWRRVLRKTRRIATIAGLAALVASGWYFLLSP